MKKRKAKKAEGRPRSAIVTPRSEMTAEQMIALPYLRARPVLPRISDLIAVAFLVAPIAYILGRLPLAILALASSLQVLISTSPLPGRLAQAGRAVASGLMVALSVGLVLNKPPQVSLGILAGIVATIPMQFVWLQLLPREVLSWKIGVVHTSYQSYVIALQVGGIALAIAHVQAGALSLINVLGFFFIATVLSLVARRVFQLVVASILAEVFSDVLKLSLFFGFMLPSVRGMSTLTDPYWKVVVGVYIGNAVANIMVFTVSRRVRDKLDSFREASPYLAALSRPLVGFMVIYGLLIVFFAVSYWFLVIMHCDQQPICTWGFKGLSAQPTFLDFLVYSSMTIATLTSDVAPTTPLTKFVSSAEAATGMLWVAAGFAAVLGYVQPRFTEIAKQNHEAREAPLSNIERSAPHTGD